MVPPRSSRIIGACCAITPISPSAAGITTMSTGRDSSSFSGLTISRSTGMDQAAAFIDSAFFTASSMVPTM
jgi:hypothetical protein